MLAQNVDLLLMRLKPDDLVLDVGGWACPFNRAQWILDAQPYGTRGFYRTFGGMPSQGGSREWFSERTWVQRDICEKAPWPFDDKQFDVVICSHTLEDLRDPLYVCSEMIRVGKSGYVEVPSRAFESCLGVERSGQAGLAHHRWLIEIDGNSVTFLQKLHMIHADWRFALPPRYRRRLTPSSSVQWLWWQGSFEFAEREVHGLRAQEAELANYAQSTFPRPRLWFSASRFIRAARALPGRVLRRIFQG